MTNQEKFKECFSGAHCYRCGNDFVCNIDWWHRQRYAGIPLNMSRGDYFYSKSFIESNIKIIVGFVI